jgi:multiple sugar transport system permease protein
MKRQTQETLTAYAFITPAIIVIGVFIFGAMIYALVISFTDLKLLNKPSFIGLDNYMTVVKNRDFQKALGNTVIFSAVVVFFQTWLALLMAVALNTKLRGMRFFRVAWYAPSVTASVVVSLIFFWLYQQSGFLNFFLVNLFGWTGYQPISFLDNTTTALPAIMTMNIFTTAPTFMIMFLAALQDIPRDVYEAAAIDGATGPRVFWKITLPLLRPVIFLVVVLGTIGTLQVFDQIYVMTNGNPDKATLTVSYLIYTAAFRDSSTDGVAYASAMAFILFIIIFTLFLIQRRFLERSNEV